MTQHFLQPLHLSRCCSWLIKNTAFQIAVQKLKHYQGHKFCYKSLFISLWWNLIKGISREAAAALMPTIRCTNVVVEFHNRVIIFMYRRSETVPAAMQQNNIWPSPAGSKHALIVTRRTIDKLMITTTKNILDRHTREQRSRPLLLNFCQFHESGPSSTSGPALDLGAEMRSEQPRPRPLDKVVDQHGPGALLVVVCHVVTDHASKVQQQKPRVLWDTSFMMLLQHTKFILSS